MALGSLLFKLVGSLIILPFVHPLAAAMLSCRWPSPSWLSTSTSFYNLLRCIAMVPFAGPMAKLCQRLIRDEPELDNHLKPKHLDPSALDTPALALANPRVRRCALVTRWSRCWRACTR